LVTAIISRAIVTGDSLTPGLLSKKRIGELQMGAQCKMKNVKDENSWRMQCL